VARQTLTNGGMSGRKGVANAGIHRIVSNRSLMDKVILCLYDIAIWAKCLS